MNPSHIQRRFAKPSWAGCTFLVSIALMIHSYSNEAVAQCTTPLMISELKINGQVSSANTTTSNRTLALSWQTNSPYTHFRIGSNNIDVQQARWVKVKLRRGQSGLVRQPGRLYRYRVPNNRGWGSTSIFLQVRCNDVMVHHGGATAGITLVDPNANTQASTASKQTYAITSRSQVQDLLVFAKQRGFNHYERPLPSGMDKAPLFYIEPNDSKGYALEVSGGSRKYRFFGGRHLNDGWHLKSVGFSRAGGNLQFQINDLSTNPSSTNASFTVTMTNSKYDTSCPFPCPNLLLNPAETIVVSKLELVGPAGGHPHQAFE